MSDRAPVLALDLGGTQLRTALVTRDGAIVGRHAQPTPRGQAADVVRACVDSLRRTLSVAASVRARQRDPIAIGVSAPGPLDPWRGVLIDPPNMHRSLWGYPLGPAIGEHMQLPVVIERDTQVAALAEGRYGAARGLTDYVYLTVSTGIGGGVVSGGVLLRGPDGVAGELGHLTIDFDGPPCGCGARGHLEAMTSGTGIARAAREAGMGDVDAAWVAAQADAGNAAALQIIERARAAFAAALVSIVDVFNPQRVIVGGGVALGQGERLLQPAREAVARLSFRPHAARAEIVPAELGDDVGLVGARALVALAGLGEDGDLNLDATTAGHPALTRDRDAAQDEQ